MNQDDTFRRLKRIPFDEMMRLVIEFNSGIKPLGAMDFSQAVDSLFSNNCWTSDEYSMEYKEYRARAGNHKTV
jgi:hypothetical protein